jgi:hypothetical protein
MHILHSGAKPPCLGVGYRLCRGCSGWRAMAEAARPGGAWQGVTIHCPLTGLTARFPEDSSPEEREAS